MSRATLRQVRKLAREYERELAELELMIAESRFADARLAADKAALAGHMRETAKNMMLTAAGDDVAMLGKFAAEDETRRQADAEELARRRAAFLGKQAAAGPLPNLAAAEMAAALIQETTWVLEEAAGHEAT